MALVLSAVVAWWRRALATAAAVRALCPPLSAMLPMLGSPFVFLGAPLIALVWMGTLNQIEADRELSQASSRQQAVNLSRVFAEHVGRTIGEIDRVLLSLKSAHERDRRQGNWPALLMERYVSSNVLLNAAVTDATGRVIATTDKTASRRPVSVGDREYFLVHTTGSFEGVFVGRPLFGRISGQTIMLVSRRYDNTDGSFGGVIVGAFDPDKLESLYQSVELGRSGSVSLVGLDGVVRATSGPNAIDIGSIVDSESVSGKMLGARSGTFREQWNGMPRTVAFERVAGHPLMIFVAADAYSPNSDYVRKRHFYLSVATALTLTILAALGLGLLNEHRHRRAQSALAHAERAVRQAARQLKLTFDYMSQGIMMVAPDGVIGFMNQRAIKMLGLPETMPVTEMTYRELCTHQLKTGEFARPGEAINKTMLAHISDPTGAPVPPIYERTRPNGVVLEVRTEALPDGGFVRTFTDVSERHRAAAQILRMARQDTLTGLANRATFHDAIVAALARLEAGQHVAVHYIDLDRFKPVNDNLGHAIGDSVLKVVAARLRSTVREGDLVARIGGDEFAVLQVNVASRWEAEHLADRFVQVLGHPITLKSMQVQIGASIGVALAATASEDVEELIRAADVALYCAKAEGRATYRMFAPEMNDKIERRRMLERAMQEALRDERFELHYQPMHDTESSRVTGFEALLRWQPDGLGPVSPAEFIPIAEESGLIVPLGAWVLRQACRDASRLAADLRISVNISPMQFRSGDLLATVTDALNESGLAADRLELEITESLLMAGDMTTLAQLDALHEVGVRLSLDDFGTGYSSLGYLLKFRFDKIKIDRSFVNDIVSRPECAAIVKATTQIAASLSITATAEGVETTEQLAHLRALGCREAQGFLFNRAQPRDLAFEGLLEVIPDARNRASGAA